MKKGLSYTSKTIVNENNTAIAMGSGDLEVFATPALVALMENAAKCTVEATLPEGSTTVGAHIQTSHIKPSALGEEVTATAILEEIDGKKLTFKVEATDSQGIVGKGTHVRYIVDICRFMSKLK